MNLRFLPAEQLEWAPISSPWSKPECTRNRRQEAFAFSQQVFDLVHNVQTFTQVNTISATAWAGLLPVSTLTRAAVASVNS